jgi:hypothetical protein
MSEPQTETDAEPTPGPVTKGVTSNPERRIAKVLKGTDMVGEHNTHCDIQSKRHSIQGQEPVANADLIVAAFNAAQEAKEMGYDPVAAVEAVPRGLEQARCAIIDLLDGPPGETSTPAAKSAIKRLAFFLSEASNEEVTEIVDDKMLNDALTSAEGSGDE